MSNTIPKHLLDTFNSMLENEKVDVRIKEDGSTDNVSATTAKKVKYETKVVTPKK